MARNLEPIRRVSGRAVVVAGDDIDTDRIIPARFLKCVTFDGLGEAAFYDERFDEAGEPKGHPIDDPRYAGASVLVSGANFGCGSSREHAPQALVRHGFTAIVAESFAEIFFGNAVTLGMPCVAVSGQDRREMAALVREDPSLEVTVDLERMEVAVGGRSFAASMPQSAREALLSGRWDPIAELLEGAGAVEATAGSLPYLDDGGRR